MKASLLQTSLLLCCFAPWHALGFVTTRRPRRRHSSIGRSTSLLVRREVVLRRRSSSTSDIEEEETEEKLYEIARRLKLEIFDLDEGIFGFDSQDPVYGLEVVQTEIPLSVENPSLGLVLTEMAGNKDGRGLVLVSDVSGNAEKAQPAGIMVGDVITGVRTSDGSVRERTTGLNYDSTVEAIGDVKEAALQGDGTLHLELNRLVKRASVQVQVVQPDGRETEIQALAGENLRRLLLRKDIRLYNRKTKRFDMPYATGDCAGEGLCGTCLVAVDKGVDLLNPKEGVEDLITRGRPLSWRASCRAVVGPNNEGGTLRVRIQPQSGFEDELNPGVKSVNRNE